MSSSSVRLSRPISLFLASPDIQCLENMHYFASEIQSLDIGSVTSFLVLAESIYEENLAAYVKLVLRRPFLRILVREVEFIDQGLTPTTDALDRITLRESSGYSKLPLRLKFKTIAHTPRRHSKSS